jgi:hypothetical protein
VTIESDSTAAPERPNAAGRALPPVIRAEAVLGVLCAIAAGIILHAGRGLTFFYDEWNFILERRGISFATFLEPHGGDHPTVLPVAAYKAMLQVFGLGDYAPYRLMVLAVHLTCAVLLFVYARRRLGPWLALAPVALLLFLGSAWQDILWPFQITYLGSLAAGLGMLLALDAGRSRDWLVCLLLTAALLCSSVGLLFVVVAAVELAGSPARWRRAWVVVVPVAILGAILLAYGGDGAGRDLASPGNALRYAIDMAAAGFGGLGGLGNDWGRPLFIACAVLLGLLVRQLPAPPVRLVALAAGAATFWLLTGISRAELTPPVPPDASRYLYPSALLILLIFVTAFGSRQRVTRTGGALLAVGIALACVSSVGVLGDGARGLREVSTALLPQMAALEAAGDSMDPGLVIDPERSPTLVAGRYLDAVASFGSPAPSLDELRRDPAAAALFDAALARAQRLTLQDEAGKGAIAGAAPKVEGAAAGTAARDGACTRFASQGIGAALDVALPPGAVTIAADAGPAVELRLRRLSDAWPAAPTAHLDGDTEGRLAIPDDELAGSWHLRLSPRQDVRICSAT